MELIVRIGAAAVLGAVTALLLRRSNPELGVPLAAAVCAFAFFAAGAALRPVLEVLESARSLSGLGGAYFLPVTKCVAIGLIARAAADLCRDAGQGAMAGAVEVGGTAAALYVSLPLLQTLLELLQRLL